MHLMLHRQWVTPSGGTSNRWRSLARRRPPARELLTVVPSGGVRLRPWFWHAAQAPSGGAPRDTALDTRPRGGAPCSGAPSNASTLSASTSGASPPRGDETPLRRAAGAHSGVHLSATDLSAAPRSAPLSQATDSSACCISGPRCTTRWRQTRQTRQRHPAPVHEHGGGRTKPRPRGSIAFAAWASLAVLPDGPNGPLRPLAPHPSSWTENGP